MVHPISGSKARNQRVVSAWLAGESYLAIGKRFGFSESRAYQIVKENAAPELLAKKIRAQKPARKKGSVRLSGKVKNICFDPADFALVERASKSRTPALACSYYIMQTAVAQARRDLGISA